MQLGKAIGPPRVVLADGETIIGEFIIEMAESETEFDAAGNRYLRPALDDVVRVSYEQGGRIVTLLELPMTEIRLMAEDGDIIEDMPPAG